VIRKAMGKDNIKSSFSRGDGEFIVGAPGRITKVLSVTYDYQNQHYNGLPSVWRELLEMPLD
jgi:hypothetical protein